MTAIAQCGKLDPLSRCTPPFGSLPLAPAEDVELAAAPALLADTDATDAEDTEATEAVDSAETEATEREAELVIEARDAVEAEETDARDDDTESAIVVSSRNRSALPEKSKWRQGRTYELR